MNKRTFIDKEGNIHKISTEAGKVGDLQEFDLDNNKLIREHRYILQIYDLISHSGESKENVKGTKILNHPPTENEIIYYICKYDGWGANVRMESNYTFREI